MTPHVVYTQEYIDRMLSALMTDRDFVVQSMHSIYDKSSVKDKTSLQWLVVSFSNSMEDTIRKLHMVNAELTNLNKKGFSAGTKV